MAKNHKDRKSPKATAPVMGPQDNNKHKVKKHSKETRVNADALASAAMSKTPFYPRSASTPKGADMDVKALDKDSLGKQIEAEERRTPIALKKMQGGESNRDRWIDDLVGRGFGSPMTEKVTDEDYEAKKARDDREDIQQAVRDQTQAEERRSRIAPKQMRNEKKGRDRWIDDLMARGFGSPMTKKATDEHYDTKKARDREDIQQAVLDQEKAEALDRQRADMLVEAFPAWFKKIHDEEEAAKNE